MHTTYQITGHSESNGHLRVQRSSLPPSSEEAIVEQGWSSEEYLLLGYTASLHATARELTKNSDFEIGNLEISLEASCSTELTISGTYPFHSLVLTITPETTAHHTALVAWLRQIQSKCPVFAALPSEISVYSHIRHYTFN